MFELETSLRINEEGTHVLTRKERREFALRHLENRLGVSIDRTDPMLGAMAALEMSLANMSRHVIPRARYLKDPK
jgi:hypothetical protein